MADSELPSPPIEPMLAKLTPEIPEGPGWLYEPKWDGFRCIVYFDGAEPPSQSKVKGLRRPAELFARFASL